MKTLTERNEKELAYTDVKSFVEALLTDKSVSEGIIEETFDGAYFSGRLTLNVVTAEIERYVAAKVAYTKKV